MSTLVTTNSPLNIGPTDPEWKIFEKDVANLTAKMDSGPSRVEYDAKLPGVNSKSPRQVDVYVEGEVQGIPIAIAIECKKYARPIDVGEIDAFIGKLHDLSVDKGVFYVYDGVTEGARNAANAALHPKVVLREFAGAALLPPPPWSPNLDELIDFNCPNENCFMGEVSWTSEFKQDLGGEDVYIGTCDSCGTLAYQCQCGEVDTYYVGEVRCYTCGAEYEVTYSYQGDGVDDFQLVKAGEP